MDFENREKLQELLLFESTGTDDGKFTTLKDYVNGMPESQEKIYFLTGTDREALANSPYLEAAKGRGFEVLLLTDPIDEWLVQDLREYDGKQLQALDRAGADLETEEDKAAVEAAKEACEGLIAAVGKQLDDRVKEVRLSTRLRDSVACLVVDEHGMSANMERIMKAFNQDGAMPSGRILELNPTHELTTKMQSLVGNDDKQELFADFVELVYAQALLNEGSPLKDPGEFAARMTRVMSAAAE
jgi:molecular chaperone HtpG